MTGGVRQPVEVGLAVEGDRLVLGAQVEVPVEPHQRFAIEIQAVLGGRKGPLVFIGKGDHFSGHATSLHRIGIGDLENGEVGIVVGVVADVADVEVALVILGDVFPVAVPGVEDLQGLDQVSQRVAEVQHGIAAAVVEGPDPVGPAQLDPGRFGDHFRQAGDGFKDLGRGIAKAAAQQERQDGLCCKKA